MKKKLFATVVVSLLLVVLLSFTVSAESAESYWHRYEDGSYSYIVDGEPVKDEVGYWIVDAYYGFDANGIMYTGWVQPYKNRLDYSKEHRNTWFYYGPDGRAPSYGYNPDLGYFFYSDGQVETNTYEWYNDSIYVTGDSGVGTALQPIGWNFVDGNYYYLSSEGEFYCGDTYYLGGVPYYFDWNGQLVSDRFIEEYESDSYIEFYVNASGVVQSEGWIQYRGKYYYLYNGERLTGRQDIGGTPYYFYGDGSMAEDTWVQFYDDDLGTYAYTYVPAGGVLLRNAWYQEDGEWYYYDNWYERAHGLCYVGDNLYYFYGDDGEMVTNEIIEVYAGEGYYEHYLIGADGIARKIGDGWVIDPENNKWMYFKDGYPYRSRICTINGVEYVFDGSGHLASEDNYGQYYHEEKGYGYYSINADGTVNKTEGWDMAGDTWVFIQSDGRLKQGWLFYGSNWYYMQPAMLKNANRTIGGRTYYFDSNGHSKDVFPDGLYKSSAGETYYYEYGSSINGWRMINGKWHYFDNAMVRNQSYPIGEDRYYFDQDGAMLTGWIRDNNGDWYFADESGRLATGITSIGGVTYAFDSGNYYDYGCLMTSTTYYYNGTRYLVNASGVVIATSNDASGWINNNGDWYYLDDGEFYYGDYYYIDGTCYYFDYDGKMVTDEIRYDCYYQANGARKEDGWFLMDGSWYYANEYGRLADGVEWIDGKPYCFRGYKMVVGTYIYGTDIVVTDASGAVQNIQPFAEGWNLVSEFGDGNYYYVEDGEFYYGWLGNYYMDPHMVCNGYYHIDDAYYYFYDNGVYAANTWINYKGEWLYAQANGKLYCDEWAVINGTWYYFDYISMVSGGVYYIDGEEHLFADNGAWLGKAGESAYADGWHMIDGKWNYCQNGYFLSDTIRKIDGVWYGFDYDGMVTNDFNSYGYYMNGSGIVQEYTGWKLLNGKWYYFNIENRMITGWFNLGKTTYYGTYDGIATGLKVINDKLYSFAGGGALIGEVTAEGWHQSGSDWYYIHKGEVVYSEVIMINGVRYAFDYDGTMITNDTYAGYLFGSNGAEITTEGWYMIDGEWLYVGADGYLCIGTHIIGGTTYYFDIRDYIGGGF